MGEDNSCFVREFPIAFSAQEGDLYSWIQLLGRRFYIKPLYCQTRYLPCTTCWISMEWRCLYSYRLGGEPATVPMSILHDPTHMRFAVGEGGQFSAMSASTKTRNPMAENMVPIDSAAAWLHVLLAQPSPTFNTTSRGDWPQISA